MKIQELPSEERPREKLMKYGRETLSTPELLAILIRSGNKNKSAIEIAMNLMCRNPQGIAYLAECTPEELMEVEGVGRATACQLLSAVELGRRIAAVPAADRKCISSAGDLAELFMEKMRHYKKEHFICVLLNAKGEIIEEVTVSIGDLSSSIAHPREVFNEAIRRSAGAVILIHNHPSGNPACSNDDIVTTRRLVEVGEIIGIPILDHIIIGDGRYLSMKSLGYMDLGS